MKYDLIIVIGAYGSGKSEYAINLSRSYQVKNPPVSLVDLDVVNPYFRSREMRDTFTGQGIEVIAPEGEYRHADLPMLSPRIMGALEDTGRNVILDVGGDPAGCRTLARFIPVIQKRGYQMQLVVNTRRPFTSNFQEIEQMLDMLQRASGLLVTELICNTNLMEQTTLELIREGIEIIGQVAAKHQLRFTRYLVLDSMAERIPDEMGGKRKVVLEYFLRKPWEVRVKGGI